MDVNRSGQGSVMAIKPRRANWPALAAALALLAAVAWGMAGCAPRPAPGPADATQRPAGPATAAEKVLALEAELGAGPRATRRLERVVNLASAAVALQPRGGRAQALNILHTIDRVVRANYGFQERRLLFEGLAGGGLDCDLFTLIYISVGQRQNLPLKAVVVPRHTFVRYLLPGGGHINWETTLGRPEEDSFYRNGDYQRASGSKAVFDLDKAVAAGAYMRSLSPDEFLAVAYVNAAVAHLNLAQEGSDPAARRGQLQRAKALFATAVARDPRRPEAHHGLGLTLHLLGRDRAALASLERAAALYPGDAYIRYDRGVLRMALGNVPGAIKDFLASWRLLPGNSRAAFSLAAAYGRLGDKRKSDLWWRRAVGSGSGISPRRPAAGPQRHGN